MRVAALLAALMIQAAAGKTAQAAMPAVAGKDERVLTVCADPNNLPFSNHAEEGFENKVAQLIAKDLQARLEYVWWAQRRGFARNTLNESRCDLWPGVATGVDRILTTRPYYRSTYVFLTRKDRRIQGLSLDDSRLKSLAIGVQMVGNDATNTPPAHALARRGITDNVQGYMLYGNYESPNPPSKIIDAVARGDIDVALVWGPLAGYFSKHSAVPLALEPVTPQIDAGVWRMTYGISVGVRAGNLTMRDQIQSILDQEHPAITALLGDFGIPRAAAD